MTKRKHHDEEEPKYEEAKQPVAEVSGDWQCGVDGATNTGKTCTVCGNLPGAK